jgi:peptidoglycan hydrolase CwlO-like protein
MRTWMIVLIGLGLVGLLAGLYGCTSDAARDEKRDADRTAMQLADVERDRDADKSEVDQLKTQIQDLQSKNAAASDQNAKLTQEVQQLQDQLAAKTATTATTGPGK